MKKYLITSIVKKTLTKEKDTQKEQTKEQKKSGIYISRKIH